MKHIFKILFVLIILINAVALYRIGIDRGTNKVYYETSPDGNTWTLRYTHSGTVTGDLRAAYVSGDSTKAAYSCAIQADLGLN